MARYVVRVVADKPGPGREIIPEIPSVTPEVERTLLALETTGAITILYNKPDHLTFDVQPPGSIAPNDQGAERSWALVAASEMIRLGWNAVAAPWSPK
jgi:hypothetical protein